MCDIVCEGAPQEQDGPEAWCQWTRLAAHRPWPVRKWFNVDHKRRRRSNPGSAMEKGPWSMSGLLHLKLPTLQSISVVVTLLPVVVPRAILDVVMSSGLQDRTQCLISGAEWRLRTWSYWEVDFFAGIRRMWGGVMWLRTGNHRRGVGHRAPETMRMDSFSWTSISLV